MSFSNMSNDLETKNVKKSLAEENIANFELAKTNRNFAYRTYPELIYSIFLKPCTVKILMVIDNGGAFDNRDFGLSELLNILSVSPGPWVRFEVTKAHRDNPVGGGGADFTNFRFDTHDLNQYDEIWLFAVSRGTPIESIEVRKLSEFMDNGGGVFATGDHEDLGVAMCGRIPRVRSMRKWYWPNLPSPFPEGNPSPSGHELGVEPIAPSGSENDRLDTTQIGPESPGSDSVFIDQSDNIPQTISPKIYTTGGIWISPFWKRFIKPHPLLCGPRGVIRVLPDHPHEGECYVPHDLTHILTFDGYTRDEYPMIPGSSDRLTPEVIATSSNASGIIDFSKATVSNKIFGAIGAYDGHRANIGRVVVDATWHHFFNVNLIGDADGTFLSPEAGPIVGSVRSEGFHHPSTNPVVYEDIKSYFRNIAVWIAKPDKIECMRWRALWSLRWHHRISMDLRPAFVKDPKKLTFNELLRIGPEAYDVLGRIANQCLALKWVLDIFVKYYPELNLDKLIDPWYPRPKSQIDLESRTISFNYPAIIVDLFLGALIYTIANEFPDDNEEIKNKAEGEDEKKFVTSAFQITRNLMREMMEKSSSESSKFMDRLEDT